MGTCPSSGQHLYTYDAEGRLIATGGTQYEYNAAGERVSKDNSAGAPQTLYLHDGDGNQIAELNAALAVQHVNVYSGRHLVGTWNPATGQVYYAYADWLGTKRYEADGAGTYVNSWASLPFGDNQTALGAGVDATEHHFTGQEHDAESGLDHFAARYYQSQTGRWLLPDWSATPVPVPYATFTNPQSLNLYTYVGNNPVNALDADGHLPGSGGSTYTAQQGSALWQCVHTAPGNGDTDGCDFGAWGVDDSGLPAGAQESYQAYLGEVAQSEVDAQIKAEQQAQQQNQQNNIQSAAGPINPDPQNWNQTPANFKPWMMRDAALDFMDSNQDCTDWLNSGGVNARALMSTIEIKYYSSLADTGGGFTTYAPNSPIFVNTEGPFYGRSGGSIKGAPQYAAGSFGVRMTILFHELAHHLRIPGFLDDSTNNDQSVKNTQLLLQHCIF